MSSQTNDHIKNRIHDVRLSSVVPASITAEDKRRHEVTNMDLIMKMHYLTTVHFFDSEAVEGLRIEHLKNPMFEWLDLYYPICGRIHRRRSEIIRPYVKCNDSGVRIVEAKCVMTMDQWRLEINGDDHGLLVYNQALIGDDFEFTPLVFLQFTWFKCGGMCVGMSWAHVLGDAFSASECLNLWGKNMTTNNQKPQLILNNNIPMINTQKTTNKILDSPTMSFPRSIKLLDSLGENWIIHNNYKMQNHTFHVSQKLLSKYKGVKPFELISAIIWKSLAKVLNTGVDSELLKIVTLCKKGCHKAGENSNKNQVIGIVEVNNLSVDSLVLAKLMVENFVDETEMVEKVMEEENGNLDFMVYGANLTFVNLEEVELYGMKMKGHGPVFANLSIGGVGDGGAVVVLPLGVGPENGVGGGRIVNVILPENQLQGLKNELKEEWGIF